MNKIIKFILCRLFDKHSFKKRIIFKEKFILMGYDTHNDYWMKCDRNCGYLKGIQDKDINH